MKTRLAPLLAALALGAAGCVDNMGSVQVFATCAFPDDCVFDKTCSKTLMGDVVLDLNLQQDLVLAIQVNNQRTPPANIADGGVDTATAYVEEFTVTYDAPAGLTVPGTSGTVTGTIPTGGSTTVAVEPITAAVGAALVPQIVAETTIVANVRFKGTYADQTQFETAAYKVPVQVCKGCVVPPACIGVNAGKTLQTCPPGATGQIPLAFTCK